MPVSLCEWRVRIGRFVQWVREYEIIERKEKALKERTRLLKILHERLLKTKGDLEGKGDECETKTNNSSNGETDDQSGSKFTNSSNPIKPLRVNSCPTQSTVKESNTPAESTTKNTNYKINSAFILLFFLLLLLLSYFLFSLDDFLNLLENYGSLLKWSLTSFSDWIWLIGIMSCVSTYIIFIFVKKNMKESKGTWLEILQQKTPVGSIVKESRNPTKVKSTPSSSTTKDHENSARSNVRGTQTLSELAFKVNNGYSKSTQKKKNTAKKSTIRKKKATTKSTDNGNNTKSQSTIPNPPTFKEDNTPKKFTTKMNSSSKKPTIKQNNTLKHEIREGNTTKKSAIIDNIINRNPTAPNSNIDESSTPKKYTTKKSNARNKSTIKNNNAQTDGKQNACATTSTTKKNNNKSSFINTDATNKSAIKIDSTSKESTIKDNGTPTQSTMKVKGTHPRSTTKDKGTSTQSTIKDKCTPTQSTIKDNSTPTKSTIKDNSTTSQSPIKDFGTPTQSTVKGNGIPAQSTIKDNGTPTESTIKDNGTPTQSAIKDNGTASQSNIKDSGTPTESTTDDNGTPTQSTLKDNGTPTQSTIKNLSIPTYSAIKYNSTPTQSTIKDNGTPTQYTIKENGNSSQSTVKDSGTPTQFTIKDNSTPTQFTIKDNSTPTQSTIKDNGTPLRSTFNIKDNKIPTEYHSKKINLATGVSVTKKASEDYIKKRNANWTKQLLIQAGDVEMNPGPLERSIGPLEERELLKLADDVSPEYYYTLCIALGFSRARSKSILSKNHLEVPASVFEILCEWKMKQIDGSHCRRDLDDILRREDLSELANIISEGTYYSQESIPTGDGTQPLTREQVDRCAEDFKTFYRTRLCKIKTNPLDFNSILEFERIYTNLALLRNEMGTTKKTPLDYTELFTTKVNGELPKRFMLQGDGGAGKTTFCSKMAWDWTNEAKEFHDFDWVLVIPLRDIQGNETVGEIARTYLSDSNPTKPCQIEEYILANPSKVFIVFDGLDEYVGDLVKQETDIAKIIRSEKFKECRVLVTTRPWKADQITSNETFAKTYAFIAVTGFNKDHVSIYITKYFKEDKKAGDELIKLIEGNDIVKENMAPFPLFVAMLCTLWTNSDANRRKTIQKLKTFSQLFTTMIIFLKDHYISKQCQDHTTGISIPKREEIDSMIEVIGKFALNGVLEKKFEYTENDFRDFEEALEACCKIGLLSREIRIVPLHERSLNETYPVTSRVFFPHKLFQEYLGGMYLSSLFMTEHESYESAIKHMIQNAREFRYLLYFTASQTNDVGLDITKRIMNLATNPYYPEYDILVDVAFEAYDEGAAKVVRQHIFKEKKSLKIQDNMSAHTISGYLFIMEKQTVETLVLSRRSCGPTVSRDLADIICSCASLTGLEISGTIFHEDFFGILEGEIKASKLERLSVERINTPDEVQSRYLARFVNSLPVLKDLTLRANNFHDCFYTELASGTGRVAESLKVSRLLIDHRFCNDILPHGFTVEKLFPNLEELFLTTLQSASPSMIGSLAHSSLKKVSLAKIDKDYHREDGYQYKVDEDVEYHPSLVGDPPSLVQVFLKSFPGLTHLTFKDLVIGNNRCETILLSLKRHQHLKNIRVIHCFTDEEIDPVASAINMEKRMNVKLQHDQGQTCLRCYKMSSGLADALCHRTSVQELILEESEFDNAWFPNMNGRTVDSKIQKLTLEELNLERNGPSASRDLATFLCLQPCLTDLGICFYVWLHDEFFHELARLASSSKVQKSQNSVSTLLMDHRFCNDILQHGFTVEKLFPKLEELSFATLQSVSPDIIRSLAHSSLKKLSFIKKDSEDYDIGEDEEEHSSLVGDPRSLEQVFLNSFPGLTDLTFKDLVIGNNRCETILLSLKQHQHLKNIRVIHCFTDEEIDPIASAINTENRTNVELQHDEGQKCLRCYQMSSGLADALCHRTSVKELILTQKTWFDNAWFPNMNGRTVDSKIEHVCIEGCYLEQNDPTASRDLAKFLCLLPCLTNLTIKKDSKYQSLFLHDDFYNEIARLASSSKIQHVCIEGCNLEKNDPAASRDLAKFLCLLPCLTNLTIKKDSEYQSLFLHDDFYHEIARLASSSKIERVSVEGCNLIGNDPAALRDLAKFLCLLPCLTNLTIKEDSEYQSLFLHDNFYHEIARLASSSKNRFFRENLHCDVMSARLIELGYKKPRECVRGFDVASSPSQLPQEHTNPHQPLEQRPSLTQMSSESSELEEPLSLSVQPRAEVLPSELNSADVLTIEPDEARGSRDHDRSSIFNFSISDCLPLSPWITSPFYLTVEDSDEMHFCTLAALGETGSSNDLHSPSEDDATPEKKQERKRSPRSEGEGAESPPRKRKNKTDRKTPSP